MVRKKSEKETEEEGRKLIKLNISSMFLFESGFPFSSV
jgi:hypothetical protein